MLCLVFSLDVNMCRRLCCVLDPMLVLLYLIYFSFGVLCLVFSLDVGEKECIIDADGGQNHVCCL